MFRAHLPKVKSSTEGLTNHSDAGETEVEDEVSRSKSIHRGEVHDRMIMKAVFGRNRVPKNSSYPSVARALGKIGA